MTLQQAIREINRKSERIAKLETVLVDLLRCGDFYSSAIEIDNHIENPINGEEFEKRIINILY